MTSPGDLYTVPASKVDYELVRAFVVSAEAASLFSESLTLEVKEKLHKSNVAEAVAALGNTDGGIVLVGVKDKDATGEDRIVGVPKSEHDSVANSLHSLVPEAMPEIIAVAIPGGDRLVLVLRVDADAVPHPVVVSGKVLSRIPGHSVPADRRRVLDLAARDQVAPGTEHSRMSVDRRPWQPRAPSSGGRRKSRSGRRTTPGRKPSSGRPRCESPAAWNYPGGSSTGRGWGWQHARQPWTPSTTAPCGPAPTGT